MILNFFNNHECDDEKKKKFEIKTTKSYWTSYEHF